MKPSFYNYTTSLPDSTFLLFNFYTLKLVPFNSLEAPIVKKILKNPLSRIKNKRAAEIKKLLAKEGFLLKNNISEIDYLNNDYYQSRNQTNRLGLTILPSLECNFNCIYCYEKKEKGKMTPEVESALIQFVKQQLEHITKDGSFSVTWFGGEPLLQMDIIKRLSNSFIKMAEEKEIKYSAHMITNGYLLTKVNIERLKQLKINRVQITLDGPQKTHDQRRCLVNGGKTFKKIFKNIKNAAGQINITLRINVDETNRENIQELLDLLNKEGLENLVYPYLGQTYPYTEACADIAGNCLSDEEFSLLEIETQMKLIQKGFSSYQIPQARNVFCLAGNNSAFVVTPSGGIVNCWNDVSNTQAEIGHLLKPATKLMRENAQKWQGRDVFKTECTECLLLPICMGGCPYLHLTSGNLNCHKWKSCPSENLAFYYYIKRVQQDGEIIKEFQDIVGAVKKLKNTSQCKKGRGRPTSTCG